MSSYPINTKMIFSINSLLLLLFVISHRASPVLSAEMYGSDSSSTSTVTMTRESKLDFTNEKKQHDNKNDLKILDDDEADDEIITCGSIIKLNLATTSKRKKYYLQSAEFKWGTGSGQQVVTMISNEEQQSSSTSTILWQVQEAHQTKPCVAASTKIKCGDTIRLYHIKTKKRLHTHDITSILSKKHQEITAFGEDLKKSFEGGDKSDDWILMCGDRYWKVGETIRFKHAATGALLSSTTSLRFDERNCPNCPIIGHLEVSGKPSTDSSTLFIAEKAIQLM